MLSPLNQRESSEKEKKKNKSPCFIPPSTIHNKFWRQSWHNPLENQLSVLQYVQL